MVQHAPSLVPHTPHPDPTPRPYPGWPPCILETPDARQDNPQKALELFQKVVTLEAEKGPEIKWRFKALEHLVRIYFQLRDFDQMLQVLCFAVLCCVVHAAVPHQTLSLSVQALWYLLFYLGAGGGVTRRNPFPEPPCPSPHFLYVLLPL